MNDNKKIIIGFMIAILVTLLIFNSIFYFMSIRLENKEHSGTITMKWLTPKLLTTWYNFEIDNTTEIDISSDYVYYKYEKGDIYNWNTTKTILPNWWLLW